MRDVIVSFVVGVSIGVALIVLINPLDNQAKGVIIGGIMGSVVGFVAVMLYLLSRGSFCIPQTLCIHGVDIARHCEKCNEITPGNARKNLRVVK